MHRQPVTRRGLLVAGGLAALGPTAVTAAATAAAAAGRPAAPPVRTAAPPRDTGTQPQPGPRAALAALLAGNRRFAAGRAERPRQDPDTLRRLASGQRPYAVVLGCADSRVPPELLFDQGLGDLFDARLAGNLVDEFVLGTVEYAVLTFASPLVVVLGHERCGAVAATVDALRNGTTPPYHVDALVAALRPVVAPVLDRPGDPVENGCRANVRAQVRALRDGSPLLAGRVARGELLIVGARYDLDDGLVTPV
ncbi:carbonic anhydrase [Micromonospora sp. R77]|uniref:carbonic anhydrase n=1 Tax=Micromonospora sp. R77 TaxID=2925836 RepID=UPI001F614F40|nr:carbonic anhydrase [Micromonospora sp. R77]MCI4063192.1 carbonic anhydrase [Micromonospora sp. R77]